MMAAFNVLNSLANVFTSRSEDTRSTVVSAINREAPVRTFNRVLTVRFCESCFTASRDVCLVVCSARRPCLTPGDR